jgi:hypothetical protein
VNFYTVQFALVQDHKFNLTELEEMLPWERLVYLSLVQQRIEKENARIKALNAQRKR